MRTPLKPKAKEFINDVFTSIGANKVGHKLIVTSSWIRLCFVIPFIFLPTGFSFLKYINISSYQQAAKQLLIIWLVFFLITIIVNIIIVVFLRKETPTSNRWARALIYISLMAELIDTQIAIHAVGTLTSYVIIYMVIIIAIYRVFFDYYLALCSTILASVLYLFSVGTMFFNILPYAPYVPYIDHVYYKYYSVAFEICSFVILGYFVTFFIVNYGINQSIKLHRYITESVLQRYIPPTMVKKAARGELKMDTEPEWKTVTVMFTDIVGFTTLSEKLGAAQVGKLINLYLSQITALAHKHSATIDKFIGDAIMLVFGVPEEMPQEEQAKRCVALACEIHKMMNENNDLMGLQIRTGINTGEAVAGHFGTKWRSDFTVIGHTVNIAARLESASKPGRILISDNTAKLLNNKYELEPAGKLNLKNISTPIEAYFVL